MFDVPGLYPADLCFFFCPSSSRVASNHHLKFFLLHMRNRNCCWKISNAEGHGSSTAAFLVFLFPFLLVFPPFRSRASSVRSFAPYQYLHRAHCALPGAPILRCHLRGQVGFCEGVERGNWSEWKGADGPMDAPCAGLGSLPPLLLPQSISSLGFIPFLGAGSRASLALSRPSSSPSRPSAILPVLPLGICFLCLFASFFLHPFAISPRLFSSCRYWFLGHCLLCFVLMASLDSFVCRAWSLQIPTLGLHQLFRSFFYSLYHPSFLSLLGTGLWVTVSSTWRSWPILAGRSSTHSSHRRERTKNKHKISS